MDEQRFEGMSKANSPPRERKPVEPKPAEQRPVNERPRQTVPADSFTATGQGSEVDKL